MSVGLHGWRRDPGHRRSQRRAHSGRWRCQHKPGVNGDFELGDPAPFGWQHREGRDSGPSRASNSPGGDRAQGRESRLLAGLAIAVEPFQALDLSVAVQVFRAAGARAQAAGIFFL